MGFGIIILDTAFKLTQQNALNSFSRLYLTSKRVTKVPQEQEYLAGSTKTSEIHNIIVSLGVSTLLRE